MKWAAAAGKPDISVHPYTPQIIVTNDSNTNLLLGYILVSVSRPTLVKSILVTFSGNYSVCWTDLGQTREEYFQQRLFHCEKHLLTSANLVASCGYNSTALTNQDLSSGWEDLACDSTNSSITNVNSFDDEPPEYPEDSVVAGLQSISNSFVLAAGTHRLEFVFVVPPRMPSTIVSHMGGIDYKLSVQMKTKGQLGMPTSTRADVPVQLVNIPTRLAQLQSTLPVNDEALFTRQIDDRWWIMVRASSCTTFPEDIIHLSVCLSWPARCSFDEDISQHLELLAVQMDLCETTVHKSMTSGKVIKTDMITVATSLKGDKPLLENSDTLPPSYQSSYEDPDYRRLSDVKQSEELDDAIEYANEIRATERPNSGVRGMFNESNKQEFQLKVPRQRDMNGDGKAVDGVHIDCRSAPISVGHQLHITLQIMDKSSQKLHLVPFHCRVIIIPEVESFLLPAYTSSLQDTRVQ